MTETDIRDGAPSDLAQAVAIDDHALPDSQRTVEIAARLADGACVVAFDGSELVGFALWDHAFFGCGFVSLLVVAKGHRRRGIGLRLLKAAEARCRTAKLFSSTNASNEAAQALFVRAGFVRSGVVENLDSDDPEIVFFKYCER